MGGLLVALRPINFLSSIILLRLLDPTDFGAVALAMILLTTSNMFSNLGMANALIQSKLEKSKVAFQAFFITVIVSTLFFVAVLTNALPLATLLGDSAISPILRWLSTLILLDGLSQVPRALLKKELQFGQVAKIQLFSQLSNIITTIVLAFLGYGFWSLVFGKLTGSVFQLIFSWILCPGWEWLVPKRWDKQVGKSLLSYGIQSTGSLLSTFLNFPWDDWLVGKVLGLEALGFYSRSYDLTNRTITVFGNTVIGSVFFPSYAKIQDNKERLARVYLKSVRLVLLIMVPISLGILAIAPQFVPLVFGEKWIPMILPLQIFAFMILSRPISTNTSPLFLATGRPNFNLRAGIVLLIVMVPLVFLFISLQMGIVGVAIAVAISHFAGAIYNVYQVNTILPGTARKTLAENFSILISGALMLLSVELTKIPVLQLRGEVDVFGLVILIAAGAIIYIGASFLIQRPLILEVLQMVVSVLERKIPAVRSVAQRLVAFKEL